MIDTASLRRRRCLVRALEGVPVALLGAASLACVDERQQRLEAAKQREQAAREAEQAALAVRAADEARAKAELEEAQAELAEDARRLAEQARLIEQAKRETPPEGGASVGGRPPR